ncbi:poly [ADP-ribose] polymerase 2-like [Dermacentor andersoni]|uniref:poly [ADP-ribose] polymerase 2-like n=1 Tax=Dermacentor andersoni TaxID=34620 RepID=UPI002155D6A7|nr:poly [ADP-ribose] polymerase 2-like [Dermacentor andersoni]
MPKRRSEAGPTHHTPQKLQEVITINSDSERDSDDDLPPVHVVSDSDDEFPIFHSDGRLERRKRSGKKRTAKEETTCQKTAAGTSAPVRKQLPSVDPLCAEQLVAPTIYGDCGVFYNVVLNQSCLQMNRNKFYNMQLVEDVYNDYYYVWFRWGRVGEKGASKLVCCENDILKAKLLFEEKFHLKTGNEWPVWATKMKFTKHKGKYDMLKMDYSHPESHGDHIDSLVADISKNIEKSKLAPSLQKLVHLICDVKTMKQTLIDLKFDVVKMPLGRLTKEQIQAGYEALHKVEDCINKKCPKSQLMDACSEFYTCVPHSFTRRQRPEMICTNEHVQEKMILLEALEGIQTSLELLKKELLTGNLSPIDRLYRSLNCELTELDSTETDYKLIQLAIKNTHGSTHVGFRIVLQHVFRIEKTSYNENFVSVGNHIMLWHGSRCSNIAGILSKGLCIAPPHVPVNGYMFGKGVYFADCVSKSANYCLREPLEEGLLLLCEVSLGTVKAETHSKTYDKLPPGINSVMGIGAHIPEMAGYALMSNGVKLACGKLIRRQQLNTSLLYNEYIVYNTDQVKMTYLVKVKFEKERARK